MTVLQWLELGQTLREVQLLVSGILVTFFLVTIYA